MSYVFLLQLWAILMSLILVSDPVLAQKQSLPVAGAYFVVDEILKLSYEVPGHPTASSPIDFVDSSSPAFKKGDIVNVSQFIKFDKMLVGKIISTASGRCTREKPCFFLFDRSEPSLKAIESEEAIQFADWAIGEVSETRLCRKDAPGFSLPKAEDRESMPLFGDRALEMYLTRLTEVPKVPSLNDCMALCLKGDELCRYRCVSPEEKDESKKLAEVVRNCRETCSTSQITVKKSCLKNGKEYDEECAVQCSPFSNLEDWVQARVNKPEKKDKNPEKKEDSPDLVLRTQIIYRHAKKIIEGMSKKNDLPGFVDGFLQEAGSDFAKSLVCLARERENHPLEPVNRVDGHECGATAFGIGQTVIRSTFNVWGITGLEKFKESKCSSKRLNQLNYDNCGNAFYHDPQFRRELFEPYMNSTPQELYDNLTFDLALQIRVAIAVFVNHYRLNHIKYSSSGKDVFDITWKNYFGQADKDAEDKIKKCVEELW